MKRFNDLVSIWDEVTNISGTAHRVDHRLTPAGCPQTFPHRRGVEKSMDNLGQPYGQSLHGDRRAAPRRGNWAIIVSRVLHPAIRSERYYLFFVGTVGSSPYHREVLLLSGKASDYCIQPEAMNRLGEHRI